MNKLRSIAWLVGAVSMVVWLDGCGGNDSPTSPSDSTSTTSTSTTPTITVTDTGVSPQQVQISVGQQVLIVNNGTSIHELQSNVHETHEDCPPMNNPGLLNPGQSGLTSAFTLSGSCGFHDHQNPPPGNDSFQGFVLVGGAIADDPPPDY